MSVFVSVADPGGRSGHGATGALAASYRLTSFDTSKFCRTFGHTEEPFIPPHPILYSRQD